jgi:hypothetical protein
MPMANYLALAFGFVWKNRACELSGKILANVN